VQGRRPEGRAAVPAAHDDADRFGVGLRRARLDDRTHRDAPRREELQQRRVVVGDALDPCWGAGRQRRQRHDIEPLDGAVGTGDRVSVRVASGIAEHLVGALDEPV